MDIDAQIPSQVPVPQPAEDLPSYLEACGIPEEDPGLASAATASLVAFLDAAAPLESTDERKEREYLLEGLKGALLEWVRETAVAKGLFPDVEAAAEDWNGGGVAWGGGERGGWRAAGQAASEVARFFGNRGGCSSSKEFVDWMGGLFSPSLLLVEEKDG